MAEKKYYLNFLIFLAIILLIILGIIFAPKNNTPQSGSTLDMNPSPQVSPTTVPEPEVVSWEDYTNDEYNFALSIPTKWYKQNYISDHEKGVFIAFSPDPLPCETCSYLHDGYFSIKVYNQKTNPEAYAGFLQRMKSIGQVAGYQPIQLTGKKGVLFENTLAIENDNWVYELSLDNNDGKEKIDESEIFKKVLSSFKFTGLIFNY